MKKLLHTRALVVKESVGASQAGVIDQIVGSTAVLDRMGDVIDQGGWDLKDFKANPVILWGHNMNEDRPPIAKALKVWVEGKGDAARLMFRVMFDLADEFAADIYRKIKEGYISTVSVGFLPTEYIELEPDNFWGGLKYLKQQLLELSFVTVPANPEALVGLRSFAKKDKRFTPIDAEKLFKPIKTEKEIAEIFNVKVDKAGKAETITHDPNATVDEEGNVTGGTGGGGGKDTIENKPDGESEEMPGYDHTAQMCSVTVKDMRAEMNSCMKACMPGAVKAQETGTEGAAPDNSGTPKDPYQSADGMGDMAEMPADNMVVHDMSVGHARALYTDIFGDWQSNLSTTSNEGQTSEDNVNNYSFDDADTKAEMLRKAKGLTGLIGKAGRVLSAKNEDRIKQAVTQLEQVLSELEQQVEEPAEPKAQTHESVKSVIAYADHGKAPETETWDGPGERAKATVEDLKIMCTWYDETKSEDKSAYKLPHHKADGEHVAVWRGVAAAMASLMGSRGGTDIPESDRKGVYTHLAKHYAEFEKEAPEFKRIEDQVLAGLDEEVWALTLDREEKHLTRLIKKVLDNQKEEKKQKELEQKAVVVPEDKMILGALKILESALTKVSSTNHREGGDK